MSGLTERYAEDGIWTMSSQRETCRVPTSPLSITQDEEYTLNQLALSVWRAQESVVDMTNVSTLEPWTKLNRSRQTYPEGLTMPPAIRVDTVFSDNGIRIIEIDPVSAISLGETTSLIKLWQEQGYQVPDGLLGAISEAAKAGSQGLSLEVPAEKSPYRAEIAYLATRLVEEGVTLDSGSPLKLSSFPDIPAKRRSINGKGWSEPVNPLWGSLSDFADKTNLELLISGDKQTLPLFLPGIYGRDELELLDPLTMVVAKPIKGMGSVGVRAITASQARQLPSGYIFQEIVNPRTDMFAIEGEEQASPYVSRVSVYAGKYGLLGAQVTARPRQPVFTNVHGQADAVQTTLAVITN